MKKKQLIIAIQAAFLSMAMGNVSAAPLTADEITNLTETTLVQVKVEDIPTDLTNSFIGKVVSLSVELNTLPPQLAQFLIDHNESADPKLSDTQIATLQQVVDTAVETAIGELTATTLDTVTIEGEQLVIGDLQISAEELQKFVVKIVTFADFSKMNPAVAQFLLDHQADFPSLEEKVTALEDVINPPTTPSAEEAIAQLTDWSTVKLDAEQNLTIGEVKIPAESLSKFIEKVAALTETEMKSISSEVAQFILDKDDPASPKLTEAQVTALKALLPATTTLTPAEAIAQLTDWSTVKLDAEQLMIGDVKIPAESLSKFIEKVAALTETEMKSISSEVAQFILDKDDPASPKLTPAQVEILKEIKPPVDDLDISSLNAEAVSKLSLEVIASLTTAQIAQMPPAAFAGLTPEQAAALKPIIITELTAEQFGFIPPAAFAQITAEQVAALQPETVTTLTADQLANLPPPAFGGLTAELIAKHPLSCLRAVRAEQIAQIPPAALKGLTPEQVVELTVAAIGGLTKEMVGSLSLEVVAALSNEQLKALSDEAKAGMTSAQVSALGDKAKEIFDEEQLIALFTTENGQVTICHIPDGDPGKANSIDISPAAVEEHLNHGDSLGPCASEDVKTVAEEETNVIEIDLAHLTAQQLSELSLEIIAQLTSKQVALIPSDAMIGMTKEQVSTLTEKCVSGLSSEQVFAFSSEALAGFNASNIGGLNQEILLAIGFDLLQLMPAEELKLLSESNPDIIVLVTINVLKTSLPPQSEEDDDDDDGDDDDDNDDEGDDDDDEGDDDDDKGDSDDDDDNEGDDDNESNQSSGDLNELLTTIGWKLQSNQLVLSSESILALSIDLIASLSVEQFKCLHPSIMAQLSTEQMSSIKEETLAQLGEEYLDQLPEEKIENLSKSSPEFLIKLVLQLDVKKIEKKFKKRHAQNYVEYLKKFYEKLFKHLGWKVEIKEKHGQFFIKIKPKKEAFKYVSKQFVSLIDFEPSANETSADLTEKLTLMPSTSLEGLEDEQIESIPEEQVEKLPAAAAKPVQEKKTVIQFVEQASTGNVTEDTVKKLTPDVIGKIGPEQVAQFAPVTFKLFTAVQLSSLPTISISVMTAPMVAQLAPEAVSGFNAAQITAIPPTAVAGFNAGMIANLQVTAVVGFKHPQLAFLPIEAMEGWQPETFAALNPNEVDGFNVYQLIQMLHKKPEIRKVITKEQWENLSITPNTPVLPVVAEETITDEEVITEDTGETTEDAGETTEDAGETTEDTGETTEDTGETTEDTGETTEDTGETTEDTGEVTPVEVTIDDETGEITLPPAEIDLSEAEGITPADLEIETVDLTTPLIIDGEELPPIVEQLEETLTDVGMPDLTITQEDGIVNVTGSGDLEGTDLAFVPDEETIVKVEEGTPAGVTQDENGFYIIVTPNGIQMTFLPAPKNPVQLLKLAHGNKGKGKLKKNKHGAFHFPVEGYGNVAAMFDPMVRPAPKGMKPGIFIEGMMGSVVYPDGTMQVMHPAMPQIAQLQVATMALLGVEIKFEYQANGTAEFEFNGQEFKAIPTFEVAEDDSVAASQPVLEVVDAEEGEQVEVLNEQGEPVSEELIAKAIITTEEGSQELNVVEDATSPESDNGETTTDDSAVPETENTTDESNVPVNEAVSDTTDSNEATSGETTDGTVPAVENGSATTETDTGEVTNENTESAPDTTPEADSVTEPADDSEGNTTSVEEVTP